MQYAEQYEIRIYGQGAVPEVIQLNGAREHQVWAAYDPIREGLKSGEKVELVRVQTVTLAGFAKF